jgi:hypothetical protein
MSVEAPEVFADLSKNRIDAASLHFLLDLDGTIYQTLDLKERAWHATTSNARSVGIEIANMGAYGEGEKDPFDEWYARDADGRTRIAIPARFGPDSFERHLALAAKRELPVSVVERPELSFDVDRPGDILTLLADGRRGRTREVCLEMDLGERLRA